MGIVLKGLVGAGVAAAAAFAVLVTVDSGDSLQEGQSVTMTGCLRGGSAAGVFVLRGATTEGQPARDYLLVQVPDGVDLPALANHTVAVSGTMHSADSGPPPPDGANSAERALRRLAVQGVNDVAPNCDR